MVQFGSIIWEVDLWRIFGNHLDGFSKPIPKLDGFSKPIPKLDGFSKPNSKLDGFLESNPKLDGFSKPNSKLDHSEVRSVQFGVGFRKSVQFGDGIRKSVQFGDGFRKSVQFGDGFRKSVQFGDGFRKSVQFGDGFRKSIQFGDGFRKSVQFGDGFRKSVQFGVAFRKSVQFGDGFRKSVQFGDGFRKSVQFGVAFRESVQFGLVFRDKQYQMLELLLPNSNPMWGVLLRQIVGLQPPCDGFPESNPKCDGFSKSNPLLSCVLLCCCFVWSVDYGPCLGWSCCFARKTLCSITSDSEIFCHFSSICVWFCKASVHRSVPKFLSANITLIPVLDAKSSSAGVTCQSWASPSHNQKIRGFSVIWVWYASCFFQTSCDFFSAGWISKMIFLHRFWKSLSFSCADFGFWIKGISTQGKWPQRSAFLRAVRTNGANFQKYVLEMQARNTFWNWHTGVLDWVGRAVVKHVFFWFKCFGPTSGFFLDTVDCINIPTCSISVVFVLR